jgi:hypothetical protein
LLFSRQLDKTLELFCESRIFDIERLFKPVEGVELGHCALPLNNAGIEQRSLVLVDVVSYGGERDKE